MEVRATTKFVRISPLKAREVAKEIQGLPVSQAITLLNFTPKKAAMLIGKTLKTAVANAEHNFELDPETLYIKTAVALTGPAYSRIKPMARGSANPIRKPTAHIQIVLADALEPKVEEEEKKPAKKAAKKPASKKAAE